jgi:hypothetical protein
VISTVGKLVKIHDAWFKLFNVVVFFWYPGYGNISPHSDFGRIFMIFYAIIGLPVNAILFAYLGDFFGKTVNFTCDIEFSFSQPFISFTVHPHL